MSFIPYIPALPVPAAGRPLPEAPAATARRPLCDHVHNVTWAVARAFGFQAFNEQPAAPAASSAPVGPDWVPATAFLAADHLEALLVRNLMPRLAEEARGSGSSDDSGATSSGGKDEEDQADEEE